jgi:membrane protease YdiL (CAAX protease family)
MAISGIQAMKPVNEPSEQPSPTGQAARAGNTWRDMQSAFPLTLFAVVLWLVLLEGSKYGVTLLQEHGGVDLPLNWPAFTLSLAAWLVLTAALIAFWTLRKRARLWLLGLRLDRLWRDLRFFLLAALAVGLVYLIGLGGYRLYLEWTREAPGQAFREFIVSVGYQDRTWLYLLGPAVFYPIVEEIWFRGLLYTPLRREFGPYIALPAQALLFAFAHGIVFPVNQFFGGLVFGYAYERTRSLVAPILLHMLGNSMLFVIAWLTPLLGWTA